MSTPLRVLVADDHAIIRLGVQQALRTEWNAEFVEAANARDALEQAHARPFDLILLDITMPGRSGLDTLAEVKVAQPKTPVLVVSMHGEEQYAVRALKAGAAGYIAKSQVAGELVNAVRKVLAGGIYVSATLGERLAAGVVMGAAVNGHESLSEREFEVLRMIAAGKSGKEIAAELSISYKTVSTYRTRILEKLDLRTNHELAQYAREYGLTEENGSNS